MTTAEQLRYDPDYDRIDLRLIGGRVVERAYPFRTPTHSTALSKISFLVSKWAGDLPGRPWAVFGFACTYRLTRNPDTVLAYNFSMTPRAMKMATGAYDLYIDGAPTLAIEVIDRYDEPKATQELVEVSMACGVSLLWVIDPSADTVEVYRQERPARSLSLADVLTCEAELPGFRCRVAEIFE